MRRFRANRTELPHARRWLSLAGCRCLSPRHRHLPNLRAWRPLIARTLGCPAKGWRERHNRDPPACRPRRVQYRCVCRIPQSVLLAWAQQRHGAHERRACYREHNKSCHPFDETDSLRKAKGGRSSIRGGAGSRCTNPTRLGSYGMGTMSLGTYVVHWANFPLTWHCSCRSGTKRMTTDGIRISTLGHSSCCGGAAHSRHGVTGSIHHYETLVYSKLWSVRWASLV